MLYMYMCLMFVNSILCSENFSFVLTSLEGNRRFGYCRRLLVSAFHLSLPLFLPYCPFPSLPHLLTLPRLLPPSLPP